MPVIFSSGHAKEFIGPYGQKITLEGGKETVVSVEDAEWLQYCYGITLIQESSEELSADKETGEASTILVDAVDPVPAEEASTPDETLPQAEDEEPAVKGKKGK